MVMKKYPNNRLYANATARRTTTPLTYLLLHATLNHLFIVSL